MDNQGDTGSGPWGIVEGGEARGFYWLTYEGQETGKSYPIGKTAYRAARRLNETGAKPEGELPEPKAQPKPEPKASKPKAEPKAKPEPKKPEPKAEEKPKASKPDPKLVTFTGTREEWLNAFAAAARPVFKQRGFELPEKVRISVGFMFRSPKAIGQCWHESASADGHREIFINPTQADSSRVADILTHELCHTLFGPDEKHGKNFKAAAFGMGLEGKATATTAGDGWREWANPILEALGPIPHAALDPAQSGVKKQSTRLLKCECDTCGFIFRATAKHVNGRVLRCPDDDCDGQVTVAGSEGEEG